MASMPKSSSLSETLPGVGGFVFVAHGNHCANELRRRNCVTGEVWKDKLPFRFTLNQTISDDMGERYNYCIGHGIIVPRVWCSTLSPVWECLSRR